MARPCPRASWCTWLLVVTLLVIHTSAVDAAATAESDFQLHQHEPARLTAANVEHSSPVAQPIAAPHREFHSSAIAAEQAPREWDLAGAHILSARPESVESTSAKPGSSAYRVCWRIPPAAADIDAPPLIFSVFAEWSFADSSLKKSVKVCHLSFSSVESSAECIIPKNTLPAGAAVSLQVLTECDYRRILQGENSSELPLCHSANSPSLQIEVPKAATKELPRILPATTTLQPSATRVIRPRSHSIRGSRSFPRQVERLPSNVSASNPSYPSDALLRTTLCKFFNETSGTKWLNNKYWCSNMTVCSQ
jgi:hypothetical protein